MHYKNGTPAKIGDKVVSAGWDGLPVAGVVVATSSESDTCNLTVVLIKDQITLTASECMRLDEAMDVTENRDENPENEG